MDRADTSEDPRPVKVRLSRTRFRLRVATIAILIGIAPIVGWAGWKIFTGNLGVVQEGRIYRSAQLSADRLAAVLREKRIKSVLNLRGEHPETAWYREEADATHKAGAVHIDLALSSSEWLSRKQALALVETIETCDKPMIVHCWRGAERTGLASAFAELLRPGGTLADAEAQFSWRYLYFPAGDGVMTARHLEAYKAWLKSRKLEHSPALFRDWVQFVYRPGKPSREDWPYDPYPVRVVTLPDGKRLE